MRTEKWRRKWKLSEPSSLSPKALGVGFWVILIIVQVLGKYMIIRYLDP